MVFLILLSDIILMEVSHLPLVPYATLKLVVPSLVPLCNFVICLFFNVSSVLNLTYNLAPQSLFIKRTELEYTRTKFCLVPEELAKFHLFI